MQVPIQIVFRNMSPSDALSQKIRERVAWLERYYSRLISARVAIEVPHRHHHKGNHFHLRLDVRLPGKEIVVRRSPDFHGTHQDLHVLIHDVFDEARRRLEDYSRKQRGDIKQLNQPQHTLVAEIFRYGPGNSEGHGFLRDELGREIFFHSNSVLNDDFKFLQVGDEVRFAEERGDKGPQASSLERVGRQNHSYLGSSHKAS